MRKGTKREQTKKGINKRSMDENFFREMNYELAGDIGAINNEDMMRNNKLLTARKDNKKQRNKNIK